MVNVFPYPGSKSTLAPWIIGHFPEHETYVEVFGGSGAVLEEKPPSWNEVFNDLDDDIVHFFTVLRSAGAELREWLSHVPFSRTQHKRWTKAYYNGYRPKDDIERAGRFFYLRNTQFAQKYTDLSGFRGALRSNHAREYANRCDELERFARRFRDVQIENLDYGELFDRYDSADTLFYCDPPYVKEGDELYSHDEFDHGKFTDAVNELDGNCIVSYTDIPDGIGSWHISEKGATYRMRQGVDGWEKDNVERLAMNFDPDKIRQFSEAGQTSVEAYF